MSFYDPYDFTNNSIPSNANRLNELEGVLKKFFLQLNIKDASDNEEIGKIIFQKNAVDPSLIDKISNTAPILFSWDDKLWLKPVAGNSYEITLPNTSLFLQSINSIPADPSTGQFTFTTSGQLLSLNPIQNGIDINTDGISQELSKKIEAIQSSDGSVTITEPQKNKIDLSVASAPSSSQLDSINNVKGDAANKNIALSMDNRYFSTNNDPNSNSISIIADKLEHELRLKTGVLTSPDGSIDIFKVGDNASLTVNSSDFFKSLNGITGSASIVAGNNINVVADTASKTVTINATASGGTGLATINNVVPSNTGNFEIIAGQGLSLSNGIASTTLSATGSVAKERGAVFYDDTYTGGSETGEFATPFSTLQASINKCIQLNFSSDPNFTPRSDNLSWQVRNKPSSTLLNSENIVLDSSVVPFFEVEMPEITFEGSFEINLSNKSILPAKNSAVLKFRSIGTTFAKNTKPAFFISGINTIPTSQDALAPWSLEVIADYKKASNAKPFILVQGNTVPASPLVKNELEAINITEEIKFIEEINEESQSQPLAKASIGIEQSTGIASGLIKYTLIAQNINEETTTTPSSVLPWVSFDRIENTGSLNSALLREVYISQLNTRKEFLYSYNSNIGFTSQDLQTSTHISAEQSTAYSMISEDAQMKDATISDRLKLPSKAPSQATKEEGSLFYDSGSNSLKYVGKDLAIFEVEDGNNTTSKILDAPFMRGKMSFYENLYEQQIDGGMLYIPDLEPNSKASVHWENLSINLRREDITIGSDTYSAYIPLDSYDFSSSNSYASYLFLKVDDITTSSINLDAATSLTTIVFTSSKADDFSKIPAGNIVTFKSAGTDKELELIVKSISILTGTVTIVGLSNLAHAQTIAQTAYRPFDTAAEATSASLSECYLGSHGMWSPSFALLENQGYHGAFAMPKYFFTFFVTPSGKQALCLTGFFPPLADDSIAKASQSSFSKNKVSSLISDFFNSKWAETVTVINTGLFLRICSPDVAINTKNKGTQVYPASIEDNSGGGLFLISYIMPTPSALYATNSYLEQFRSENLYKDNGKYTRTSNVLTTSRRFISALFADDANSDYMILAEDLKADSTQKTFISINSSVESIGDVYNPNHSTRIDWDISSEFNQARTESLTTAELDSELFSVGTDAEEVRLNLVQESCFLSLEESELFNITKKQSKKGTLPPATKSFANVMRISTGTLSKGIQIS